MMLRILKAEIARLRREESGVALMLTLSVFLLLYVVCAGVYSIGETVRQKVELQNACDSAAYSAALVQADGLSRMAMINRALSWTYVQLTNMQIDYITYKWLSLVSKRFGEDRNMCSRYNSARFGGGSYLDGFPMNFHCHANNSLTSQGIGWFCGAAGYGMDTVRVNNNPHAVSINDVDRIAALASQFENYADLILQFKQMIAVYNLALYDTATNMQNAVANTAQAVLLENLPRGSDGEIDVELARDFIGYRDVTYSFSPYLVDDDGNLLGQGGYFSPLFNTEFDERIFLTMADGNVYEKLTDYFGPSGDTEKIAGGLDQWFIRSYPDETHADVTSIAPKFDIEHNLGICRVYKNANRMSSSGNVLNAYRAHHRELGSGDSQPSCINTKAYCPEQCRQVDDSVALYADYEWSSGRYKLTCIHVHEWDPSSGEKCVTHFHTYDTRFLETCNSGHNCSCGKSATSHRRSQYMSCVAGSQRLMVPVLETNWPPFLGVLFLDCYGTLELGRNWMTTVGCATYSNSVKPNGFARIYGDDREIYDKRFYTGEPAQPWILNENFYGRAGAIVVGLARRQRNPWSWLLGNSSFDQTTEGKGIYSAFDPIDGNYITAFSAARAAHRFSGSPHSEGWGAKEFETRFDRVCEEDNFVKAGIDCVCMNTGNQSRLAKCWNLCETDWDATLLPVKYAWSLATTDSETGESSVWSSARPGTDAYGRNPIAAAADNEWIRFYSNDGRLITSDSESVTSGDFLKAKAPSDSSGQLDLVNIINLKVL